MNNKEIIFEVNKKELLNIDKDIRRLILKNKDKISLVLEFNFDKDKLNIKSIGSEYSITCKTNYSGRILIPYLIFKTLANYSTRPSVKVLLLNKTISFENKKYTIDGIIYVSSDDNDEFETSLGYSHLELLSLKKKYSKESIERRNFWDKIESEEERYQSSVSNAYNILKRYEIGIDEIYSLINKKMEKYL